MADDKMKKDDRDMNLGGTGQKNQGNYGQKTPGRGQQNDNEFTKGQRDTSQRSEPSHMEDDFGSGEQGTGQSQGGKNRQNF